MVLLHAGQESPICETSRALKLVNLGAAALASIAILFLSFIGLGSSLPALGPAFNPVTGGSPCP